MTRLLAVVPAGDDPVAAAVLRALRDTGHEVVHAGGLRQPAQVVATAVQEDVGLVLVLVDGDLPADDVRRLLAEAGADDVDVLSVAHGTPAVEALRLVREQLGAVGG